MGSYFDGVKIPDHYSGNTSSPYTKPWNSSEGLWKIASAGRPDILGPMPKARGPIGSLKLNLLVRSFRGAQATPYRDRPLGTTPRWLFSALYTAVSAEASAKIVVQYHPVCLTILSCPPTASCGLGVTSFRKGEFRIVFSEDLLVRFATIAMGFWTSGQVYMQWSVVARASHALDSRYVVGSLCWLEQYRSTGSETTPQFKSRALSSLVAFIRSVDKFRIKRRNCSIKGYFLSLTAPSFLARTSFLNT